MNEMKKSYRNADATPQIRSHWNEGETAIGNWCVDKCDRVKECELYDGNSTQSGAREREKIVYIFYAIVWQSAKRVTD